ncbi:MAG TPA: DUF1549 domain-containing protein [Gemmatales bacterium]|nr:DUF1549 domain-containing protein [Gemmatales bacterium]
MKSISKISWYMAAIASGLVVLGSLHADDKKSKTPDKNDKVYGKKLENVDIIPKEWLSTTAVKLSPAAIDEMLKKLQSQEGLKYTARTTDEQFVRRVYLDLAGKLPEPTDIKQFIADKSAGKRSELINRLLASDDFNKHWAKYLRDVVATRATEQRSKINEPKFEAWLAESIRKNEPWSKMVNEMITSTGEIRYAGGDSKKSDSEVGAGHFLLTHLGADANIERAADTARVFMGIQIQCAQCHDHPNDIWKREQFHELVAFYARTKDRPVREENRIVGFTIFSALVGEHRMPDKNDPQKTYVMQPKFLTGETPKKDLSDEDRRKQLAQYVTSDKNYWFYANMVNRVWGDLMGQSFYNPVDNMGPLMEATYPEVLLQLAQHFKESGTDIRDLYRLIMNSQTYQRQVRLGETADQHLHFAGNYPSRLTADEIWDSLVAVLGPIQQPQFRPGMGKLKDQPKTPNPADRLARRFGFEGQFKGVFAFDPTAKQDEVESTISQALMLMNQPQIQMKMRNGNDTSLGKILKSHTNDKDAVQAVYLRVLARSATPREEKISTDYIQKFPTNSRYAAYEDLFWVLVNSAEFQTKR